MKTLLLIIILHLSFEGSSANYAECSVNFCQQNGNCLRMSESLSPYLSHHQKLGPRPNIFVATGNQQSWFSASKSCLENGGQLLSSGAADQIAIQHFLSSYMSEDRVAGVWIDEQSSENKCTILDQHGVMKKTLCSDTFDVNTGAIYLGLCHSIEEVLDKPTTYYYSCQCKQGYGYENCTEPTDTAGALDFGQTFCQKNPQKVTLTSASQVLPLIFIDHVAYGSPLIPPDGKPATFTCRGLYASSTEQVVHVCFLAFLGVVRTI